MSNRNKDGVETHHIVPLNLHCSELWRAAVPHQSALTQLSQVMCKPKHLPGNVDKPLYKDMVCISKSRPGQGITVLSKDLDQTMSVSDTCYPEGNAGLNKVCRKS